MIAFPSKSSIDAWGKLCNSGLDHKSMLPYYKKFHTFNAPPKEIKDSLGLQYIDEKAQGSSGPIQVSFCCEHNQLEQAWKATFNSLGLEATNDPITGEGGGGQNNAGSVDPKTATRSHAAATYYNANVAKRANLRVVTEALVGRIIISDNETGLRATGVCFIDETQQESQVFARKEVILAAGALQSPQLLELSGIGSADILRHHGIDVILDQPFVGENLQDHVMAAVSFETEVEIFDTLRDNRVVSAAKAQYENDKTGPFAGRTYSSAYVPWSDLLDKACQTELMKMMQDVIDENVPQSPVQRKQFQVIRSLLQEDQASAVQYSLIPAQINVAEGPNISQMLKPVQSENYFTILTSLSHPFSRGSVHINSSDPSVKPTLDPNYLSHPLDKEILALHLPFLEILVETEPLAFLVKGGGRRIPADIDLHKLAAARQHTELSIPHYHLSGTCAMMPKGLGGVVDERLRVHEVGNLRVVDSSIFPIIPRGNIQSTVYAVAERAADIIKEDLQQPRQ